MALSADQASFFSLFITQNSKFAHRAKNLPGVNGFSPGFEGVSSGGTAPPLFIGSECQCRAEKDTSVVTSSDWTTLATSLSYHQIPSLISSRSPDFFATSIPKAKSIPYQSKSKIDKPNEIQAPEQHVHDPRSVIPLVFGDP
jgi:hypothetical protein